MASESVQAQQQIETLTQERDQYKKLYGDMLAHCRKLELGILGQKSERFISNEAQLTLSVLGSVVKQEKPVEETKVEEHTRQKPTGRKPLPEHLPRVDIEVLPPEVETLGTDAFEKIGEDVTETIEHRPSSTVIVRTHRGKWVAKDKAHTETSATVMQAPPPELPIPRGLAGPGFLADTIVRRWQDHQPLHRQERIYGREGLDIARSTICGWHSQLMALVTPVINAMWEDALTAPYLCTDATGVLVQALEKCRNAHFFVVAAPDKHVMFFYSEKHDSAAVDELLADYRGYLVADAHSVYDHLYRSGEITEVACWAHARRYFFKALDSDPQRSKEALTLIQRLFRLEREIGSASPEVRSAARARQAEPIVREFFAWCDAHAAAVLDQTPIYKAIGYARNQREALCRFLEDSRLPLHNNFSERALRREALGRKNWLFVGSDEGGDVNATFVSLLASCQLHDIEPTSYLRDLFCLLPSWPASKVLDLAPAFWRETSVRADVLAKLEANPFRTVSLAR